MSMKTLAGLLADADKYNTQKNPRKEKSWWVCTTWFHVPLFQPAVLLTYRLYKNKLME